jgi:dTMP kinase
MTGRFITLEGGEGSGKTTQIELLRAHYNKHGKKCLITREPGGSPGAEAIRNLLLTGSADKWNPIAETLLFQAARIEHVEHVIKPALARGEIVICDRFLDSTLVYQGIAKGLGIEYVRTLHQLTLGDFAPDLTLILDIDPSIGLKRASVRAGNETRFENMDIAFHKRVREGFLMLAEQQPERYKIINATQRAEVVNQAIIAALAL